MFVCVKSRSPELFCFQLDNSFIILGTRLGNGSSPVSASALLSAFCWLHLASTYSVFVLCQQTRQVRLYTFNFYSLLPFLISNGLVLCNFRCATSSSCRTRLPFCFYENKKNIYPLSYVPSGLQTHRKKIREYKFYGASFRFALIVFPFANVCSC